MPYRFTVSEDEYENQKSLKGNLYLHDPSGGPNMCVSWTLFTEAHGPSSPGLTLLGKIFAADTTKAIEIKPWKAEAGTKLGNIVFEQDTVSVALKQADQTGNMVSIKPDFAGRGDKLPETQKQKIPGVAQPVTVKPGWEEILEDLVTRVTSRLQDENPQNRQGQAQPAHAGGADGDGIDPADLAAAAGSSEQSGMRARA